MQNINVQMRKASELLASTDACRTVEDLAALVKRNDLPVKIESISSVSEPSKDDPDLEQEVMTLDDLKGRVKEAIRDRARRVYIARQRYLASHPEEKTKHKEEQLVKAIETCPTIDRLFELVKSEHIVIPMSSFSSASGLPKEKPELKPKGSPLDRLKKQVLDAIADKTQSSPEHSGSEAIKPDLPVSDSPRPQTPEQLLRAIDTCPSIDKLFAIVKNEHIVIQMQSFNSASSLPRRVPKQIPDLSPLDSLKIQVRQAVMDAARLRGERPAQPQHTKEQLIRAVEICPTIDKLFELVKNEHIVIKMKSFNSASGLPQRKLSGAELKPDSSPLDRLKKQVLDAVING